MRFTPGKPIPIGLVALGLLGAFGTTRAALAQSQTPDRNVPTWLMTPAWTIDRLTAEELDVRIKFAGERLRLTNRMHSSGDLSALNALSAREEVAILRSLAIAQVERLRDGLELLRIEKDVRHAELKQAQANVVSLKTQKEATDRLRDKSLVAQGESTIATAKLHAAESEVVVALTRIHEAEVRIQQAERRLEKFEAIPADPAADALESEPNPNLESPATATADPSNPANRPPQ